MIKEYMRIMGIGIVIIYFFNRIRFVVRFFEHFGVRRRSKISVPVGRLTGQKSNIILSRSVIHINNYTCNISLEARV